MSVLWFRTFIPRTPLISAEVAAAVYAEWSRRKVSMGNALITSPPHSFIKSNKRPNNNKVQRFPPPDPNAYCDFHKQTGHSTQNCITKKRIESRGTAQATVEVPSSNAPVAEVDNNSDGSVYKVKTSAGDASFIIDSSASHLMVKDLALLNDIRTTAE